MRTEIERHRLVAFNATSIINSLTNTSSATTNVESAATTTALKIDENADPKKEILIGGYGERIKACSNISFGSRILQQNPTKNLNAL